MNDPTTVVRRAQQTEVVMSAMRFSRAGALWFGVWCLLILAHAGAVAAQQIPDRTLVPLGSEIRAEYRNDTRALFARGVLQSSSELELSMRIPDGSLLTIPGSALLGLEVHRGRSRGAGAWKGLRWGALTGAVALGLLAGVGYSDQVGECQYFCPDSAGDAFLFGAIVGGTLGAPIGLTIGAARGSERWERVR